MPVHEPPVHRRWICVGKTNHLVSETDDGYHMTHCRLATRGQEIFHGATEDVRHKCPRCLRRIALMNGVYSVEEEGRPRIRPDNIPSKILSNIVVVHRGRVIRKKMR